MDDGCADEARQPVASIAHQRANALDLRKTSLSRCRGGAAALLSIELERKLFFSVVLAARRKARVQAELLQGQVGVGKSRIDRSDGPSRCVWQG